MQLPQILTLLFLLPQNAIFEFSHFWTILFVLPKNIILQFSEILSRFFYLRKTPSWNFYKSGQSCLCLQKKPSCNFRKSWIDIFFLSKKPSWRSANPISIIPAFAKRHIEISYIPTFIFSSFANVYLGLFANPFKHFSYLRWKYFSLLNSISLFYYASI